MWQLIYQFSLFIIQPLLESIHYDLINSLCLSISLWVSRGGIPIVMPRSQQYLQLKTIVRNECTMDPKPSDNIFLDKSLCIHVPDICQWFSFNPLGEVVCVDQQPSPIPCCLRERPYNIQAPLSKRPRVGQRIKDKCVMVWVI